MSTTLPPVRFLRVIGHRSHRPAVLAVADDHLVRWQPDEAWTCECDADDGASCEHVNIVNALLDPRVLGGEQA